MNITPTHPIAKYIEIRDIRDRRIPYVKEFNLLTQDAVIYLVAEDIMKTSKFSMLMICDDYKYNDAKALRPVEVRVHLPGCKVYLKGKLKNDQRIEVTPDLVKEFIDQKMADAVVDGKSLEVDIED